MGLMRRLFGRKREVTGPSTPGEMLDGLAMVRELAERRLLGKYEACPECESKRDFLRLCAWAKNGEAGWTVTCINCDHLLERTVEVKR